MLSSRPGPNSSTSWPLVEPALRVPTRSRKIATESALDLSNGYTSYPNANWTDIQTSRFCEFEKNVFFRFHKRFLLEEADMEKYSHQRAR